MPPGYTDDQLANMFNDFFITKITKIMDLLEEKKAKRAPLCDNSDVGLNPPKLCNFRILSEEEVTRIVLQSPSKCCKADPIDTGLLKEILPSVSPILTALVNHSLQSGEFPEQLKEALVRPLLKKANLELVDKNYRPVSNLECSGKLIEKAATDQITEHISDNNLMEPLQSAYHSGHSTETALLKVKSDILKAIDNQEIVCLVLLDLSVAFDTILKTGLLSRLEKRFGISGMCLNWIESYLTNHTQKVCVGSCTSTPVTLLFGVPQGSVLGPILFTLYTCLLGQICARHSIIYHLYADDTQVYLLFKPHVAGSMESCISQLEACIAEVKEWMTLNLLKLNDDKTEFILFGTYQQLAKLKDIDVLIAISNTKVLPVDLVHNLGYFMDKLLKNSVHINKLTSGSYYQLRNVKKIRDKLDLESAKTVVQALVMSKLDYCNSLLLGSPEYQLDKLQRIKNMACRVVTNLGKYEHISASMKDLHWLKVKHHIDFKIATLMHNCKTSNAPWYLMDLLPNKQSQRTLRSSTTEFTPSIYCKTSLAYNSAFPSTGPRIWNSLPPSVRCEKDKTLLGRN